MATEQDHVWAMLDDMLMFLAKRHVPTPERTYKLDGGWTLAMDDLRRFVDRLTAERDQLRAEVDEVKEQSAYWEGAAIEMRGHKEAAERERDEARQLLRDLAEILNPHESCDATKILGWARDTVERAREADVALAREGELREVLEAGREDRWAATCGSTENGLFRKTEWVIRAEAALTAPPSAAVARLKAGAYRDAAQRVLDDPRRWPTVIANHIAHDLCAEADRLEKEAANGR